MTGPTTGPDLYRVPAASASTEIEVRRSRFVATLERVDTEEAARAVIARVRASHPDARHHCSAYVLEPTGARARSNDDGEPSGTAGAPMLEVLRGHDLSDVVVVVTRWFGGVLLGAGGLVRAYGDAVRSAVEAAGVLERRRCALLAVRLDHGPAARLESELRAGGGDAGAIAVVDAEHAARVTLRVAMPSDGVDAARERIAALTAGAAQVEVVGTRWQDAAARR